MERLSPSRRKANAPAPSIGTPFTSCGKAYWRLGLSRSLRKSLRLVPYALRKAASAASDVDLLASAILGISLVSSALGAGHGVSAGVGVGLGVSVGNDIDLPRKTAQILR